MALLVRKATKEDLNQIVCMQEAHREEVNVSIRLSFNRELCIEKMAYFIQDEFHQILVVHKENSKTVLGYIWLYEVHPHYSQQFYFSEVYTYVLPESRNLSVLALLLRDARRLSLELGACHLQVASLSGNTKLSQAYRKRYEYIGEVFNINL